MHKLRIIVSLLFVVPALTLSIACSKNSLTAASDPPFCFTVSGFRVSVNHMWKNSTAAQTENVQGLTSFTSTVSTNGESHKLEWTNIKNDYSTNTVTSFNLRIDGVNYAYPANKCQ